jgi:hypothetical protein
MRWFDPLIGDPLPSTQAWLAPMLTQYLGESKKLRKPKPIGDAPSAGLVHLVSQRAVTAFPSFWEKYTDLYPVRLIDSDQPYFMVHAKLVIDALDRDNSSGTRKKHGGNPTHFSPLETWSFREEELADAPLFRLPDSDTALYVTDVFKRMVVGARLKGFCLKTSFWEESPFCS